MSNSDVVPKPESDPAKEDLATLETRQRIANLELERQKLVLETRSLARQLSWQGVALEWLRSAAVPVTLLGAALAFIVGFGQLRQSDENRLADRFDKALTRLASERSNERMTGASGLRLFLVDRDSSLQAPALHFLINAMSVERDPLVQGSILDVLADLKATGISDAALGEALQTAVERNRSLTHSILDGWRDRIAREEKRHIAQVRSFDLTAEQIPSPIPRKLIAKLSIKQYLDFLDSKHGPFDHLEPNEDVPLHGLAKTIAALIALGAKVTDFSGIYCERCDFTPEVNLDGTKFDNSFLGGADFSHVKLRKASFHRSDLGGTIFFAADLSNADLRDNTDLFTGVYHEAYNSFPLLDCANLKGADLTGTPLLTFDRDFGTYWSSGEHAFQVTAPKLMSAQVDESTKLERFSVSDVTEISDAYLFKHPAEAIVATLYRYREGLPDDPLLEGGWSYAEYYRRHLNFAGDDANSTIYLQSSVIERNQLSRIRDELKPFLKGFLDQPVLASIPLLSAFSATLEKRGSTVSSPRGLDKGAALQWSETKKNACSEIGHPHVGSLILDSGEYSEDAK